ncbi:MAG: hypothetical protein HY300_07380 [Verrucomicrobia bacterium]|nr:hypothetical protein [Verrucomicrobiota bacterium]
MSKAALPAKEKSMIPAPTDKRLSGRGCPSLRWHCLLFLFLFFVYSYVHQGYGGGTSTSRVDLLFSLLVSGNVKIDAYHENTSDKSYYQGHYYSDKAPGTALLAAPGFAVGFTVANSRQMPVEKQWLVCSWFATAGSCGLLGALGGVALFGWLRTWVSNKQALVTVLALSLGGPSFPYATMLYSHAIVIALLVTALLLLGVHWAEPESPRRKAAEIGAGFACGLAIACEYSAGIAALAIPFMAGGFARWGLLRFISAMLVPLGLIPLYQYLSFGSPFTLTYLNEARFVKHHSGFVGINFPPKLENAYTMLFSARRGLFYWTPFLLLALVGMKRLLRISARRFWVCYLVPLIHVTIMSGYWDVGAGLGLGSRLLSPIVPFLALPAALGLARFPRVGVALAILSILMTGLGTIVSALVSAGIYDPLRGIHWPGLKHGVIAHNLGMAAGLPAHVSVLLLCGVSATIIIFLWKGTDHKSTKEPLSLVDDGICCGTQR